MPERLKKIRAARGGGSVTAPYYKIMKKHIEDRRLSLHQHTVLDECQCCWDDQTQTWKIVTSPHMPELEAVAIDYVYFATGVAPDYTSLPFLQTMQRKYPLHGHGGFPCLSEDLMWRGTANGLDVSNSSSKVDGKPAARRKQAGTEPEDDDTTVHISSSGHERIPLFVTGRLASLRLGPGAGNLEGARLGAERIAWALQDVLRESVEGEGASELDLSDEDMDAGYRYAAGLGSRFESLDLAAE